MLETLHCVFNDAVSDDENAAKENIRKMAKGHKPRKAAVKRIKVTGAGKLRHRKAGLTHLQTKRSSRTQMRNGDGALGVAASDVKAQERLLGMG